MTRGLRIATLLACALCVVVSFGTSWQYVVQRVRFDSWLGDRRSSTRRLAALQAETEQMVLGLAEQVRAAREQGHEKIAVSYAGKGSNVIIGTAVHLAYPMQILEQKKPNATRAERLDEARRRGATLFVSVRPTGWHATLLTDDELPDEGPDEGED